MKIATPLTSDNQIDGHFGHSINFRIFDISENKTISETFDVQSTGCGCKSSIAGVLGTHGVKIMLVGGIGEGAIHVLGNVGIQVIRGCSGNAEAAVKQYLAGNLTDGGDTCNEHEHGSCGH
ncbi:MAG: hypothetical protein A2W93_11950 [Bacteroidetes bacterium GWF2_43_63]|nr:MAG: hypothetical protein A2W94_00485 [Bacteroidetes bacterium GWE2_42_42]OFY55456.1 MAG: hypothetical protein A2W93_11950 [Bacteroidetes bacterium GWF2_43_63]HBG70311.1 dinitrogenase iron-molybdenum cofactor biosynthesis protein [Bacteroidales bacterium]HCB60304.1 dinitrogenase iron-molybdenum cofactor biosynthesis protein [Bacteroidales bacterium]HCY23584.1 dinitrogenase iron-molybdenum cofactor biosynthesis protein [Bacteroidales bacterium]